MGRRSGPPRTRAVTVDRYQSFIPDWPAFVAASERPEPTVIRVRTGRVSPGELGGRMEAQGYRLTPLEGMPSFFRVDGGSRPITFTLEYWLGLFYVQQASTGVAAPALAPQAGERVLDMCAAPGGKTTHICELMGDRGAVVAAEVNEGRIRGLLGNVYRLGHPNILVVSGDGRDFPEQAAFDRVLVDAPCSGEGTLRRRGGRPPNQSVRFMGYVGRIQEALLRKAIRVTRPGGTILYVTCTFAPEENERIVTRVLRDAPVELEPLALPVPHAPGLTSFNGEDFDPRLEGAARIYPHHLDSGGLFLARLRRLDDGTSPAEGAWGPVPAVYADDPMPLAEVEGLVEQSKASIEGHFGVDPAVFQGLSWIARGGRLWLHGAQEWPVDGWTGGGWRAVSLGFRAVEFDTSARPRPTNDVMRWLGDRITTGLADVDKDELLALCAGRPIPRSDDLGGLLALRYRGTVVGRGITTKEGVRGEISKALAKDLRDVLEERGPVTRADRPA